MVMDESRMFWFRFMVLLSVSPMLENDVLQFTLDVLVLCVMACGLYMLVRLLRSKLDVAKFTLAENVLKGLAFWSCRWLHCSLKLSSSVKSGMPFSPFFVS